MRVPFPSLLGGLLLLLWSLPEASSSEEEVVECLYVRGEYRMDEDSTTEEPDCHRCIVPEEPDGSHEMIYELSKEVLQLVDVDTLKSGISWLTIVGGSIHRNADLHDNDRIVLKASKGRLFYRVDVRHDDDDGGRGRHLSARRANGRRTVVMVRVLSRDGLQPTYSRSELEYNLFNPNDVTVASQYRECSGGALDLIPSSVGGVVDLRVNLDLAGAAFTTTLENALESAFESSFGNPSRNDHVLYCMPAGMNIAWSGFTFGTTYRSYYNNERCGYLTQPVHELGHNLGWHHSRENNDDYGDRSCYMGKSYRIERGPAICFNAHKMWVAGWYQDKAVDLDPSVRPVKLKLVAFTDASKIRPNDPVYRTLVRVGDMYMVFNRSEGPNEGVIEKRNRVAIVQADSPNSKSEMLYGLILPTAQSYTRTAVFPNGRSHSVTVEVCERTEEGNDIDIFVLGVRLSHQATACNLDFGLPGNAATPLPTVRRTTNPTPRPTRNPTPQMTQPPTLPQLPGGIKFCFSATNRVEVQDERRTIRMGDLRIGDRVLVDPRTPKHYQAVYGFGHYHESLSVEYLQIHVEGFSAPLEITEEHMVFVPNRPGWYPASSLQTGDILETTRHQRKVLRIQTVVRRGLYGPLTPSGTIVVNGVLASNYVGLHGDSPVYRVGTWATPLSYQWLGNAFELPHRTYCRFMDCRQETYTEEGLSTWMDRPYQMTRWLLRQGWLVQCLAILVTVILLVALETIHFLSLNPVTVGTLMAILGTVYMAKKSTRWVVKI